MALSPEKIQTRLATDVAPSSYNSSDHSVNCIISGGAAVERAYGTEVLKISESVIDTSRVRSGLVPLLDSHQTGSIASALGRVETTWIKGGALWGRLVFNRTKQGQMAEAMVARGELRGISCGYSVQEWSATDQDGDAVNLDHVRFGDEGLIFTATKWTLMETSIVTLPADASSGIRSLEGVFDYRQFINNIKTRMRMRQRMSFSATFGDNDA